MYKYALLFILLTGCAATSPSMAVIETDYRNFAEDCGYWGGKLSIDRPLNERRVKNAPVTVWEMKDAVCTYPGERPVRMYY